MAKRKSPYKKRFVNAQKKRLLEEREKVLKDIEADEADFLSWRDNANSGVDQHPADEATALTEQELDVTLIGNAKYILFEIDDALRRIEDGTYGWDAEGECWIREERLLALPWAFQVSWSLLVQNLLPLIALGVLAQGIPYLLYFLGLQHVNAQIVSVIALLEPVGGILIGILLYQEIPGPIGIAGIVMIFASIILVSQ